MDKSVEIKLISLHFNRLIYANEDTWSKQNLNCVYSSPFIMYAHSGVMQIIKWWIWKFVKFTKLFRKEHIPADCCFRSRRSDKFHYSRIRSASFPVAISTIGPDRLDCFVAISSVSMRK